jgi:hypothetical protein
MKPAAKHAAIIVFLIALLPFFLRYDDVIVVVD